MDMAGRRFLNPYFATSIVLWIALYGATTLMSASIQLPRFHDLLFVRLITCGLGALMCGWLYLTLTPLRRSPIATQAAVAVLASAIAAGVWAVINEIIIEAFDFMSDATPSSTAGFIFSNFNMVFWLFTAWCAMYVSIEYRREVMEREIDLARARELALDAQNRMLRYQLNPHFLFNTLNALSALVLDYKREQAERVLMALSRFLRYSLEQDPAAKTPLAAEIAAQEEYLAIEQIRFGDKLRYSKKVAPDALDALVPCFILQPAVENSMKYAVAPSVEPVTVEISADIRGDQTVLAVRDDGAHGQNARGAGLGVGLENVRRRLELIYGTAATMTAQKLSNGGYELEVRVPLERVEGANAERTRRQVSA